MFLSRMPSTADTLNAQTHDYCLGLPTSAHSTPAYSIFINFHIQLVILLHRLLNSMPHQNAYRHIGMTSMSNIWASLSEISTKYTMNDCDLAPLLVECWSMVLLLVPPPRRLFMFRQIKGESSSWNIFLAAMHLRLWFTLGRMAINTKEWEVCTGVAYLCRLRCHKINESHRVPRANRLNDNLSCIYRIAYKMVWSEQRKR